MLSLVSFIFQFLFGHLMYVAVTLHILKLEFLGPSKQECSYGEGGGGNPPPPKKKKKKKKKIKKKKIMLNVKQMDKEKNKPSMCPHETASPPVPPSPTGNNLTTIQVSGTVITEIANRLQ